MSLATAPQSTRFFPTVFSQRLLEAASLDGRRGPHERRQRASLLDPFAGAEVDGAAFKAALQDRQWGDAELSGAARVVLALLPLCSHFRPH